MKGVVLAGGLGTRLQPMTRVTNKHLLPVYDRPMIYYPIQQLVHAGVEEILLVTGGESAGDFLRLLGDGRGFGLGRIHYTYQEGEGGIAEALGLARNFADGDPIVVLLGDNIFQDSIAPAVDEYRRAPEGAMILLKEVDDPHRFGVVRMEGGRITEIVEKPASPPSRLAVTGCYLYDHTVWEIVDSLEPSRRGELEITDVNNHFLARGALRHHVLPGWWTDAGTVASLYRATRLVAEDGDNPVLRRPRPVEDGAGAVAV
ncbi:MAG TPA: sugar phosphate nucleotidyltransferase [Longimicrobiales bacterium]|nr:sugar phosphate nucleotidyltransferase [Longimicrobiales bacterium]